MGGDCGSRLDQKHCNGQIPDFNSTDARTGQFMGSQNQLPSYMFSWPAMITTSQDFTLSSLAKPPQPHFDHGEPHSWFYCLSTFRQAMSPPNSVPKEHLSVVSPEPSKKDDNHNAGQQFHKKQLLIFDQTGDQTTMIYSSGVGTPPMHCVSNLKEKKTEAPIVRPQHGGSNMMGNADTLLMDEFVDICQFGDDQGSDLQSEMHEDTEELNALMYSDGDTDSDYDVGDEVTSTGHSPGTLIVNDKQGCFAEVREEVASSDEEPTKRLKLSNGWNGVALNNDLVTTSCATFSANDDTESRCGSAEMCDSEKTLSLSGKKRARKDSIRETVRTLRNMIPCGNGATPIEVIDEAINFLLSLKLKAKALGFDSTTQVLY